LLPFLLHFKATILAFKLSQARILDSKRKFEEASKKYHEISFTANLDEEERESCLSAAVVCGVLAPAGPNRTRLLTNLFRDERSVNLLDYKILSKMVLGQIIRDHEMVEFEKRLKAHQLAKLPKMLEVSDDEEADSATKMMITAERRRLKKGPENVFDRAVMQHNLLSVSRIYNRISFKGLGNLVGLTSTAVEIMARTMIQENRLKASIDQVDKLITFKNLSDASEDDVVVSNVAAAAISNENNSALNSSEKDQLIAIAPSLFVWDESVRLFLSLFFPHLGLRLSSLSY
jgi:COP9 signalosome complex subunit 4